jgi:hypothetical protein
MNWTLVSAVNNPEVLRKCLLASPGAASAVEVIQQGGYRSAAMAYNTALAKATSDLVVFAHQDVYLPEGWFGRLRKAIEVLEEKDPHWGVLGNWGMAQGLGRGHLYCGWAKGVLGSEFAGGIEVETLDEVLLVLRKSAGLVFDEGLNGFHMYGADICLQARQRGLKAYAVAAFCIHNAGGYGLLPLDFWRAYWQMRWKWKRNLPIRTTCTKITFWCWPMLRWNLVRSVHLVSGRAQGAAARIENPGLFYEELVRTGRLAACLS